MKPFSTRVFTTLAIALAVLDTAATGWQAAHDQPVDVGNGCGWDGASYCAMTQGQLVAEPFSRRVLLPWVVSLFAKDSPVGGFKIVNAIAVVGLVVATLWLLRVLAPTRFTAAAVLSVGSLVLLNPWTAHLYFTYPVLTDFASAALAISWCATALRPTRAFTALGFLSLVLLGLTREQWPLVVVGAAWMAVGFGLRTWRWALATTGFAAAVMAFVFTRPTSAPAGSLTSVIATWVHESFANPEQLARMVFMAITGLGLLAFVPLLRPRSVWRDARLRWICVVAIGDIVVSLFAGGDTDRILMPSGLLLLVVGVVLAVNDPTLVLSWALLAIATVITWHPFILVGPNPDSWETFYGLRDEPIGQVMNRIGTDTAATALFVVCAAVLSRPRGSDAPQLDDAA